MIKTRLVSNTGSAPMLIFVEPEAMDYWLLPGESAELRASVESLDADFEIESNSAGITVFPPHGMDSIEVFQGDVPLECGHQRPPGYFESESPSSDPQSASGQVYQPVVAHWVTLLFAMAVVAAIISGLSIACRTQ